MGETLLQIGVLSSGLENVVVRFHWRAVVEGFEGPWFARV